MSSQLYRLPICSVVVTALLLIAIFAESDNLPTEKPSKGCLLDGMDAGGQPTGKPPPRRLALVAMSGSEHRNHLVQLMYWVSIVNRY